MTITADFSGGEKTVTTEPLYQWDTGQKLALSGLPATSTDIQVHFANAAMPQAIVKATELVDSLPTCDIPNEFLQYGSASKARAWVFYRTSNTEGYTVRTVLIPVAPRKRPNDYVSPTDPDSKGIVDRALELLEHYQSDLNAKEEKSNKKTTLTGNESSNDFYPTTKAVVDYARQISFAHENNESSYDDGGVYIDDATDIMKMYYVKNPYGARVGILFCVQTPGHNYGAQVKIDADGNITTRVKTKESGEANYTWKSWSPIEVKSNKKTTLTGNEQSNVFYPTTKAVADALSTKAPISTAFTFDTSTEAVPYNVNNPKIIYLNALANNKKAIVLTSADNYYQIAICFDGSEYSRQLMGSAANTYSPWALNASEDTNNKKNEITDANKSSTVFYPSVKAVVNYLTANYLTASETNTSLTGKESISNRLTSSEGIDANSTDTEYPSAKAVFNFGVDILDEVADDLVLRENLSNKKNAIAGNETSEQYYPTTKAVYDYVASSGLTENFKQALLNCFQNVAWINNRGQTFYQALYDALYPPKNLVSISAIFTQGRNVIYTTDSLDMLKQYLVVTAHYEDSSSKTITDYTLSGTLTAGTSVITVSYGGKTTTFNVTVTNNGIVIVIDGTSIIWELGYVAADGNITQELMQGGTYTSDFVNVGRKNQAVLALDGAAALRFAFYDSSKTFISRVLESEADVPANAAYLRATIAKGSIGNDGYDGAGTTITLS